MMVGMAKKQAPPVTTKTKPAPLTPKAKAPMVSTQRKPDKPDPSTLPRATHEGKVRIGDAEFDCYILPGGVRVMTERTTLRAVGAEGKNARAVLSKNTEKNTAPKPVDSPPENVTNQRDSGHLGRAPKLHFHPPVGNVVMVGYTLYQVIDFLRDWSGRFTRGELRENQKHIGLKATQTLIACAGLGLEAMVDDACGYAPDETRVQGMDRWLRYTRNIDVTRILSPALMVEVSRLYNQPYKPGERPPAMMKQFAGSFYKAALGDTQYERFKEVCDAAKSPDEVRNQMYQFLADPALGYFRDTLIVAEAYAKTSRTAPDFWNKLRAFTQGQSYQFTMDY